MKVFFESCVLSLFRRSSLFLAVNVLYFGFILVGAVVVQFPGVVVYEWLMNESVLDVAADPLSLGAGIFLFNLVVSGLFLTTFSGLVFFVLPFGVVLWRALAWGTLIAQLPSPEFFAALPTFVLEGEGYVIAAVAGVILGLSWLKPDWVFRGENLSRKQALTAAMKECLHLYVFVVVLLLVAAVVETVTLTYILSG